MSRHTLRDDSDYQVVVGWDPPLRTFFAQVMDKTEHARRVLEAEPGDQPDDVIVLWEGTSPNEILAVERLCHLVAPWVEIDNDTSGILASDRTWNR